MLFPAALRADCPPASAPVWQQADTLQALELWVQAAHVYIQILAEWPNCQRARVMLGACQFESGQTQQAVTTLESGIALDEHTWWAEVGLYYLAAARHALGQDAAALEAIDTLALRFPDSPWHARAQIIAAQIAGVPTALAEAAAAAEEAAFDQYRAALQADDHGPGVACLQLLEAVVAAHPNSGAARRALESKGHIHMRNHQRPEGLAAFEQILAQVGEAWPQSRVVANAKLGRAAAFFEMLMHPSDPSVPIPSAQWEQARAFCEAVVALEQAPPLNIARAKLMKVETYHWQKRWADTLQAAQQFIDTYNALQFRREVATAHMVAGEALHMMRQPGPAMEQFQWIINEYAPNEEIWPGLHNLARTYYWRFDIFYQAQAPLSQLIPMGNEILGLFPGTRYAELVQNALDYIEQNGWPNP
jgi:tetratricopeptide (TPR) repeat protein